MVPLILSATALGYVEGAALASKALVFYNFRGKLKATFSMAYKSTQIVSTIDIGKRTV